MHIASITNPAYSTDSADSSTTAATSSASPISRVMAGANARLQSQLDAANAQISSFGQLKASVAEAQLAGRALTGLATTSTVAEAKAAALRFIVSFNSAVTVVKTTSTASSGSQPELARNAARVKTDLTRTLSADMTTVDALKKMGILQSADGTLTLNVDKFSAAQNSGAAAVQTTLAKVGQALDKTAARELASDGHISGSMASLSQRATQVTANRNALLAMEQKITASQTTASSSSYANRSLAAYLTNS